MAIVKILPIRTTIEKSISYITDPGKTESCLYVSSENCVPETAAVEFQFILDKAWAGGNTIGRHLIQSFAPGETTPEQAHEIGQKLAAEILGGDYAVVIATHLDRGHIHNHFVWCAVNMVTHKKYVSNKASYHRIQDASDRLCSEYSLSVITEKSGRRGKSYTEYHADRQNKSWKTVLRRTIDAAILSSNTFEAFLAFMQDVGYEVKHGAYIAFRATGQERFTRAKTIGYNYTEERIRERIAMPNKQWIPKQAKPAIDKVIARDNEKILSSPAYSQWASMHNLRTNADTFNYLYRNYGASLSDFERHYADCIARREAANAENQTEIKNLVIAYKTRPTEMARQVTALKSRQAKAMTELNAEIAEMERVRENVVTVHGEKFYNKNSRRKEMSL